MFLNKSSQLDKIYRSFAVVLISNDDLQELNVQSQKP